MRTLNYSLLLYATLGGAYLWLKRVQINPSLENTPHRHSFLDQDHTTAFRLVG